MSKRRQTVTCYVGGVPIGSAHPVGVQSMTNTDTADAEATALQVAQLAHAGSEIVRITVNNKAAAKAVPEIQARLADQGVTVPLVGDFHFNGHVLLREFPAAAEVLAKYRINPGNVGTGKRHDENFLTMVEVAKTYDKPVRIGVNWGSLDAQLLTKLMDQNAALPRPREARDVMIEAMLQSALLSAELAETHGLGHDRIILSAKVSNARDLWDVYRLLAARCDYPLHLGLTEAGMGVKGVVASAVGLSVLLAEGIGDTIRVSLTPEPGAPRTREVEAAQEILAALDLRKFAPHRYGLPGLWSHHQHALSGDGPRHPGVPQGADAGMERPVSGRRGAPGRGHGLRRQRPRRIETCRHRHFLAGYRRRPARPGLP